MCTEQNRLENGSEFRELLRDLRSALQPTPLPETLTTRIRSDWDARRRSSAWRWTPTLNFIGLAAAACLTLAVLSPTSVEPVTGGNNLDLSPDDAAEIVAAYDVLSWDNSTSYSLNAVGASLDRVQKNLNREPDGGGLPWGADDDWDVPAASDNGSSRGCDAPDAWCAFDAKRAEMTRPFDDAPTTLLTEV